MKDFYRLLQVSRTASQHEIKVAYRKTALALHPDRHDGCEIKAGEFKDATEAYQILSDHRKRTDYDAKFYSSTTRRPPPSNYRKVYAPRPPPGFKTFDHKRHYDMHYGDGMMKEAMEDMIRRNQGLNNKNRNKNHNSRQRSSFFGNREEDGEDANSPLGKGFRHDGGGGGGGGGIGSNPYTRRGTHQRARTSRDEMDVDYEEGYMDLDGSSKARQVLRSKESVTIRMQNRRKERRRNRIDRREREKINGKPAAQEDESCTIM